MTNEYFIFQLDFIGIINLFIKDDNAQWSPNLYEHYSCFGAWRRVYSLNEML